MGQSHVVLFGSGYRRQDRVEKGNEVETIHTCIRLDMILDILLCWVIFRFTPNVDMALALIHSHVIKLELGGEYHRRQVNVLPVFYGAVRHIIKNLG